MSRMIEWYRWEWVDKGALLILNPWIPVTRMDNEDGITKRICVAPSPGLAFMALRNCAHESSRGLFLYRLIFGPIPQQVTRDMVLRCLQNKRTLVAEQGIV